MCVDQGEQRKSVVIGENEVLRPICMKLLRDLLTARYNNTTHLRQDWFPNSRNASVGGEASVGRLEQPEPLRLVLAEGHETAPVLSRERGARP